jgi:2,4-dienoyl-CoA reductase-like NADH-dependent reductase (Old Yellow Enzyme family)/thioredoxin reductase
MYEYMFESLKIGRLQLNNRIIMAPMATHFATYDGFVTQRLIDYYVERARSGVGMIVTESCYVHPEGKGGSNRLSICDDKTILGLKQLASAIHIHETKVAVQLHHGGRQISPDAICQYPVSASSIPCVGWGVQAMPRTLSVKEIGDIVEAYGNAAKRAKEAGYDAIQILAAHGYLLWSFLSPLGNSRKDKFGGRLNNRMRFLLDIIKCIKEETGTMPIMVRINGSDYINGGITLKDSIVMARRLEKAGVDAINVSAGTRESHEYQVPPRSLPEGCNAYLSAGIKKAVDIPVSIAGRIKSPDIAENILREEKADLIELGRALLCDPKWPLKVSEGKIDDILPCISCIRCDERLFSNLDIACTVNAAAGRESDGEIRCTNNPKKILVVGGGPAGLDMARVAALRGHKVVLYEKDTSLGGNLRLAAIGEYNIEFQELIDYLKRQIIKLGVKIKLGKYVTVKTVEKASPDVVVVATGSNPILPSINGIEFDNVVTAHDVLSEKSKVGQKVVIWGSGLVAFDTADFLSEKDKQVTVITRGAVRMSPENSNNKLLLQRVCQRGVRILINTCIKKITQNNLIVERFSKEEVIEMDNFVLCLGYQSNKKLFYELEGKVPQLYAIGDCVEPREAFEAIQEGYQLALRI